MFFSDCLKVIKCYLLEVLIRKKEVLIDSDQNANNITKAFYLSLQDDRKNHKFTGKTAIVILNHKKVL